MSLAQFISFYFTLNLLVAVSYVALFFCSKGLSSSIKLRLNYFVLFVVLLLSFVQPLVPHTNFLKPVIRVWSAESIDKFSKEAPPLEKGGYVNIPLILEKQPVSAARVSAWLMVFAFTVSIFAFFRIFKEIFEINRVKQSSFLIRKIGAVRVYLNDDIKVPFSFWAPGHADVVIPSVLTENFCNFDVSIKHELQHHRQRDTVWVYVLWALKAICGANIFIYLWSRKIAELQEFACDETLVDRKKVNSQQYARCLIQVAESASRQKFVPDCATGLIFLANRNLLKRRIEKMMISNATKVNRSAAMFALGLSGLLVGVSFASSGWVQDRRIDQREALEMASKLRSGSGFQVEVNDLVLRQLNRYVGTPEGREFMKKTLTRMNEFRPLVEKKLSEYAVPIEMLAVPVIESGYQNLEEHPSRGRGAGLWQFIPSTARNFGLRVDSSVDERLNTKVETDAAMRYLKANYLRFNDWRLSLLAYNIGEGKLNEAIRKTGSRDAFTIVRAGYENDSDYLAKVMAAVLILGNPEKID